MFKTFWFQTHWLLGITAGLVLALMGVSGALLSFETEILRALNPGVMTVPAKPTPLLTPPELLEPLQTAHPDRVIGTLSVSTAADRAARVGFLAAPSAGGSAAPNARPRMDVHFVDPYDGRLIGSEDALRGHDTLHVIEDLHRRLAAGDSGKALTGASTLILLVLAGPGLYLRWPRRWRDPSAWFAVRWRQRKAPFLRSLHEVFGTWLLLPYLLVALTGLWWSYEWYREGVLKLAGASTPPRVAMRAPDAAPVSADTLRSGWSAFLRATASSGYSTASFNLPAADQPLVINYLDADPAHERASNRIALDPASGTVRSHERYADKNTGGRLAASMFVLHKGSFFGLGGTLLMMLASLAMPLFAITGWLLYLQRRRLARLKAASLVVAKTAEA